MKPQLTWWEKLRLAYKASDTHDAEGRELVDPRPMEAPSGFKEPPTMQEMLSQLLVAQEVVQVQRARGDETFEDSLDFDVDDDPDAVALSPHEMRDMQEEVLREGAAEHREEEVRKKQPRKEKEPKGEKKGEEKVVEKGSQKPQDSAGSTEVVGEGGE